MTIRDPGLLLQKAIRDRLIATPDVTDLVPANRIVDCDTRPEQLPVIQFGYCEIAVENQNDRLRSSTITRHVHVWTLEDGSGKASEIADAIGRALAKGGVVQSGTPNTVFGYCQAEQTRLMRDPDHKHGHAIVIVRAYVTEFL